MRRIRRRGRGWIPDAPDERDYCLGDMPLGGMTAPLAADLSDYVEQVYDQGRTNSCVANAIAAAYAIRDQKARPLSRLFIYFNARAYMGSQWWDGGCAPRNALRGLMKIGAPAEDDWTFTTNPLRVNRRPSWRAYSQAYKTMGGLRYARVVGVDECKVSIAARRPVLLGMQIGREFSSLGGKVLEPTMKPRGRHMVLIVGYDMDVFTILNSYGKDWGINGFGQISAECVSQGGDCYALT